MSGAGHGGGTERARGDRLAGLKRSTRVVALIGAVFCGLLATQAPATAATGPVFPVMNTSETPPDGVWFRNSPQMSDTSRITGLGVYMNERIQASCYVVTEPVGRYGNQIWYYAYNVTRLTVAGRSNEGWINTHFVNDGMTANHAAPSVPSCNAVPPVTPIPVPPPQLAVYYSPYSGDTIKLDDGTYASVASVADATLYSPGWIGCSSTTSGDFSAANVTTLAGWSVGRMGPIYFLRNFPARAAASIHYIILFDPGSYRELKSDCQSSSISQVLQNWLLSNDQNHLVIMAGAATRDVATQNGPYAHRGIQEVYFPAIRTSGTRFRVTVCNYDNMTHPKVWINFQSWEHKPVITGPNCPVAPDGTQPNNPGWHP